MTDESTPDLDALRRAHPAPPRHGQLWTEDDFEAVMNGCREEDPLDEIARRIGRSVGGLRAQLYRLLPLDERYQVPVDLVPLRLRQLDADGSYDWRAALAERAQTVWAIPDPPRAPATTAIGAMSDEMLVSLAASLAASHFAVHPHLQQQLAGEVRRRDLERWVAVHAHDALDRSLDDLLAGVVQPHPGAREFDGMYPARPYLMADPVSEGPVSPHPPSW